MLQVEKLVVLDFDLNNKFNENCTKYVRGQRATELTFGVEDTATKMFYLSGK